MARPGDAAIDPARWATIQTVFHEAADLPPSEQRSFLEGRCGEDRELFSAVTAMLEEDRGVSLLDRDVAHAAAKVLANGDPTLPTQQFGPYRIQRLLGEGGMGLVYLGGREDLGSLAAIKILRDAWLSPARRERFAAEQRTLAQLNHPAIARLYDADTLGDGTPWIAMEYVEGVPLTSYCTEHRLGLPERLRLFLKVCEAVLHAHQHLVVHRDLKPSNILVNADGQVKLLDFGIAKQLESVDLAADQTRTLQLMTPAYAAPEQIRGDRVGIHTDVYALGVVLYQLLTGRLPFDLSSQTPGQVEAAILGRDPERPSVAARQQGGALVARKAVWAELDVLILTAMQKEPDRRYQSVEALMRDVEHFLAGEPLEARPDHLGYRLGKFIRRNRGRVMAASLSIAAMIGLVAFYTIRLTKARNAALVEAARAHRIQRFTLSLFEGGDKEAGPADSLRVVTLVDRGLQEARTLTAEPAIQAEVYGTLGSIYQKLGNLGRADSLLSTALERRQVLFAAGSPELTESAVALGLLRVDQAKLEEAQKLIEGALQTAIRRLPATHPAIARATFALAGVLQARGKYEEAIRRSDEAIRLYSTAENNAPTPELAAAMSQLADDHFYAGHYEVSDSVNFKVLEMYRTLYGSHHPLIAGILINLGASRFQRGKYAEAEDFDRQGLGIIRSFYGNQHRETAYALTQLGRALVFEKKFDEGIPILQQALAINESVFGAVHPAVASTLNELGNAAFYHDDLDAAEANFARMVRIYRTVYGEKHHLFGIALSNFAGVQLEKKHAAEAERLYRQVVQVFTESQGASHLNTGIARIKLGRSILRQGRYREASAESLAGYEIVSKLSDPGVSYLVNARKDLIAAYDSLREPDRATRFRSEVDSLKKKK